MFDTDSIMMKIAFCIVAVAALPLILDLLTRVKFPPPAPGSGIVITGASTGIGRHAAEWMANKGFVVYAGIRKDSDADSIRAVGIKTLIPVHLDVTDEASIASAVDFVSSDLQKRGQILAGLVNNAGVGTGLSIEFADISSWKWMYDVNVFGVVRCTQACFFCLFFSYIIQICLDIVHCCLCTHGQLRHLHAIRVLRRHFCHFFGEQKVAWCK